MNNKSKNKRPAFSLHHSFLLLFSSVVNWLTAPITDPATAAYPAMVTTVAGNATGAEIMAALTAAKIKPMFLSFLKKPGVGDCALCIRFIIEIL